MHLIVFIVTFSNVKITFVWDVIMCASEECTASDSEGGGSTFLLVGEFLPVHGIALQKMIIFIATTQQMGMKNSVKKCGE
jgi:hypothetical protein